MLEALPRVPLISPPLLRLLLLLLLLLLCGGCVLQVAVLLQLLEQLRRKPMFRLFVLAPAASVVFDTDHGEQAYNRIVPLPLGLDNLQVSWSLRI
jgi:hypothetical protein